MLTRSLLVSGILSSILYILMNIFIPLQFPGYSLMDYTVSELSAIDAPTRPTWVQLGVVYELMLGAFAWGILRSARKSRRLRMVGILMLVYCAVNLFWPPMHARGVEPTLTDTLHIVWAFVAIGFMLTMMGYGANAFGEWFRIYTTATLFAYVIFGSLMSFEAPDIPKNLPTPYLGLWERIMIGLFLLWIVVLSIILLRKSIAVPSTEPRKIRRSAEALQSGSRPS